MNKLKERIKNGERLSGAIVSLTDPCLCEIFGNVGFDYIWIDMEHTYTSYKEVLCHLNAARSTGTPAIVRVPQNDLTATKKVLEMGPDGIIFPMVRSAEEVNALIDMTLYPPRGTRGFGPMRAIGYDASRSREYVDRDSLELCRFVQIEHIDMIDELDLIAKHPYVDGFIFGPNDLSGSLGEFLNVFGDATVSEMKLAIEILRQNGKYVGIACGSDRSTLEFWAKLGFDMIFAGADWNFIYSQAGTALDAIRSVDCKE